jgi:hypothetical protein
MAITEHVSNVDSDVDAVSPSETAASLFSSIKSLARFFITWVNSCADYYAAAAMYERLGRLSNVELHARGLSRDTLARDVFESCASTDRG